MNEYQASMPYVLLQQAVSENNGSEGKLLNLAIAVGECRICGVPTLPLFEKLSYEGARKASVRLCRQLGKVTALFIERMDRYVQSIASAHDHEAEDLLVSRLEEHFQIVGAVRAISEVFPNQPLSAAFAAYQEELAKHQDVLCALPGFDLERWVSQIADEELKSKDFFLNGTLKIVAERLRKEADEIDLPALVRRRK